MINIPNLTPKQQTMLDVMMHIENAQQVNDFINSLPYRDKIDAHGLLQIAIVESMELDSGLELYANIAKQIIDKAAQR